MSYFEGNAAEDAASWIKELEEEHLPGVDKATWFSGLSEETHQLLNKFLADKLYDLHWDHLGYYEGEGL